MGCRFRGNCNRQYGVFVQGLGRSLFKNLKIEQTGKYTAGLVCDLKIYIHHHVTLLVKEDTDRVSLRCSMRIKCRKSNQHVSCASCAYGALVRRVQVYYVHTGMYLPWYVTCALVHDMVISTLRKRSQPACTRDNNYCQNRQKNTDIGAAKVGPAMAGPAGPVPPPLHVAWSSFCMSQLLTFLSPKVYVVSCRFHGTLIVFLSVCKFVMSSVVHHEGRRMKV